MHLYTGPTACITYLTFSCLNDIVDLALPVLQPLNSRLACFISKDPQALLIASSTPNPETQPSFAAFTIASPF